MQAQARGPEPVSLRVHGPTGLESGSALDGWATSPSGRRLPQLSTRDWPGAEPRQLHGVDCVKRETGTNHIQVKKASEMPGGALQSVTKEDVSRGSWWGREADFSEAVMLEWSAQTL